MEKKHKIVMKKLQFVISFALGSNSRGVIIREQYNSSKWELLKGIIQGAIAVGGKCPEANVLGGNCPRSNCPRGNCPRTYKFCYFTI